LGGRGGKSRVKKKREKKFPYPCQKGLITGYIQELPRAKAGEKMKSRFRGKKESRPVLTISGRSHCLRSRERKEEGLLCRRQEGELVKEKKNWLFLCGRVCGRRGRTMIPAARGKKERGRTDSQERGPSWASQRAKKRSALRLRKKTFGPAKQED